MKKISIMLICCTTFVLFSDSALAQDQNTEKEDLVQLTVEER
jgi:hypothetical protein